MSAGEIDEAISEYGRTLVRPEAAEWWPLMETSFVPPGDRLNPYKIGTTHKLNGGWQMKVNSATLDATAEVEAVTEFGQHPNPPPPPGAQYALVNASMTLMGPPGVSADLFDIVNGTIYVAGKGNSGSGVDHICTPPGTDLATVGQTNSGQTVTGNFCFEINASDARTLILHSQYRDQPVWFALH